MHPDLILLYEHPNHPESECGVAFVNIHPAYDTNSELIIDKDVERDELVGNESKNSRANYSMDAHVPTPMILICWVCIN